MGGRVPVARLDVCRFGKIQKLDRWAVAGTTARRPRQMRFNLRQLKAAKVVNLVLELEPAQRANPFGHQLYLPKFDSR